MGYESYCSTIGGKQIAKKKLPTWFKNNKLLYPFVYQWNNVPLKKLQNTKQ